METFARSIVYCLLRLFFGNRTRAVPLSSDIIRKVLVFRYDRIGDMVLTTPIFDLMQANIPQAIIHVLASPANAPILRCDNRISKVYIFRKNIGVLWHLRKQIKREQYDVVLCLVFNKTWDGLLAQWLCGSETVRITVAHESRIKFYEPLYDVQSPRASAKSIAELHTNVLAFAFGWDNKPSPLTLRICPAAKKRQYNFVQNIANGRSVLLINCSAGSSDRSLSSELAVSIAKEIQLLYPDISIMVIAAPNDNTLVKKIGAELPSVHQVPILNDIHDVCALVQEVSWLITPDTSLAHFAVAAHTPLVGLYKADSLKDKLFVPVGVRNEIVCADEGEHVRDIESEKVIAAFVRLCESSSELSMLAD